MQSNTTPDDGAGPGPTNNISWAYDAMSRLTNEVFRSTDLIDTGEVPRVLHGQLSAPIAQCIGAGVARAGSETGTEVPVESAQLPSPRSDRCLGNAPAVRVKQAGFPSLNIGLNMQVIKKL
jgi:hypothetical protein